MKLQEKVKNPKLFLFWSAALPLLIVAIDIVLVKNGFHYPLSWPFAALLFSFGTVYMVFSIDRKMKIQGYASYGLFALTLVWIFFQ